MTMEFAVSILSMAGFDPIESVEIAIEAVNNPESEEAHTVRFFSGEEDIFDFDDV